MGDGFELAEGMSFNILRIGGTLTGQYDGLGEGDLVGNFGDEDLFITYDGSDGNDVTLFTVPEPTMALTWSMLIVGVMSLASFSATGSCSKPLGFRFCWVIAEQPE